MTTYTRCIAPVLSSVQFDLELSDVAMDALRLLSKQRGCPVEEIAADLLMQELSCQGNEFA
jgi:hypothetical protein